MYCIYETCNISLHHQTITDTKTLSTMKNFNIKYTINGIKRTTGFISETKETAIKELKEMYPAVEKVISVKSSDLIDFTSPNYVEY